MFLHIKNLINEFLLTGWVSKRVKRHSLMHMCRSVTSGNIQISCPPETVRPLTLILCFRRSALTVGDGRVGEGEPGTDGGSGHPGGPAVVQRGRRGDTTGETEHTDEDMRVRGPLWLQRCAWEWCHRKRRQCSSCYRAGKKISHFQQWEETWCKSISGERARARSTRASKPLFRFGVISTSCGYRRDLTCIQNNLTPWSVYGFAAGLYGWLFERSGSSRHRGHASFLFLVTEASTEEEKQTRAAVWVWDFYQIQSSMNKVPK